MSKNVVLVDIIQLAITFRPVASCASVVTNPEGVLLSGKMSFVKFMKTENFLVDFVRIVFKYCRAGFNSQMKYISEIVVFNWKDSGITR